MRFNIPTAEIFIPDGLSMEHAIARTTHMAISAHQDDIEIMAAAPILECFQKDGQWFSGIVMTDGSGSPRDDLYKNYSDEQMRQVRRKEQKKAAIIGEYAAQFMLDYPSNVIKAGLIRQPIEDLIQIIQAARPKYIYTHNLADKHDTHVAVALLVIQAIRELPEEARPLKLFGCEVWRDLDWLVDEDKVAFNLSAHENLQTALLGIFDSQISGGKRYDLATIGRRRANATYYESHEVDINQGLSFGMDLTPLVQDPHKNVRLFIQEHIERFAREVSDRMERMSNG